MTRFFGSLLLLSAIIAVASTTGGFSFQNIGSYPNSFVTYPRDLNSSRVVVGFYQPIAGFYHGYLQVGKQYRTIEPPGVLSSYLQGINDKGTAVGGYCDTASCGGGESQHGYLHSSNGKYTKFDYPTAGYSIAPEGINNLGQVVGGYCTTSATCPLGFSPSNHAFLLDHGRYTTLDFPGALGTLAYAINDSGSIAGFYEDSATVSRGYLYQNGTFIGLNFPNSQWTVPLGINNAGTVSGIYQDNNLMTHGFTYINGVFTRVDPPNSTASDVAGINNLGDVIAQANVNNVTNNYIGVPHK
jgi:probable HAF family extracellular repeat protein